MIWDNKRYLIESPKHPNYTIEEYNKYVAYENKRRKISKMLNNQYDVFMSKSLDDMQAPTKYVRVSIWSWENI